MKLRRPYDIGTNNRQRIDIMKTTVQTMLALNKERSNPRRVVYNSPELPKPAPKDAPRCCNNTSKIVKIADTKVKLWKNVPNSMILLYALGRKKQVWVNWLGKSLRRW